MQERPRDKKPSDFLPQLFSSTEWLIFVLLANVFVRSLVGLASHSGMNQPPLFGDYEAQRHWMEITRHLSPRDWYRNTTDNDLLYWGLDYPPLTAYHSWALGWLAHFYEPDMVALHSSRGYMNDSSKAFMRNSVILMDILMFIPALYSFCKIFKRGEEWKGLLLIGLQPALLLIDHGHFQYNSVGLSLALWGFVAIVLKQYFLGSALIVWSVHFKIMGIYFIPIVFFHILGAAWKHEYIRASLLVVFKAACGVVFGVVTSWGPYLFYSGSIVDALNRMFPVNRGLFEDKVANFWCSMDPFLKTRAHFTTENQVLICMLFVHGDKRIPCWILNASMFSLFPLLFKDGLLIPFISVSILYNLIFTRIFDNTPHPIFAAWHKFSIVVFSFLCVCHVAIAPPQRYPDIFPYLIAAFAFVNFFFYWILLHATMFGMLKGEDQLKIKSS